MPQSTGIAQPGELTDTLLVLQAASGWRLLLAVVVALAVLVLTWRGLRGEIDRWRRWLLFGLRAVSLALLALLLLEPALQHRQLSPLRRRLVVAVDASRSMALPADAAAQRRQRVAAWLQREAGQLDALSGRFEIASFHFDSGLRTAALQDLGTAADGAATDLLAVLEAIAARAGDDLAAVVLISDGADTTGLGRQPPERAAETIAGALDDYPVPVNTFAVGGAEPFRDLAIAEVSADDFAFIRNAVEVEVELVATGLGAVTAPVSLEQEGRNLASTSVQLEPGEPRRVTLRFVPDRVGKFVYRVSTPVVPGERLSDNNQHTFVARIIRDKIRVLHLVGRPSWDVRFLRQALKRNPNVDLVSFFILRTAHDAPGVSQDRLSLIPFPVDELFGHELPTFDAVVFQNFNHGPYRVTYYLPQLAEYVSDGGALLMIGGDLSFGAGGYGQTPLESVLPVRLAPGDDLRDQAFRAVPSSAGADHPVLDVGLGDAFDQLPPFGSFNQAEGLQPQAVVLVEHPFERSGDRRAPILALRQVERGRSAALLTDGLWRWNFLHAGQGGAPRIYHRLFNNLLHWLIRDPGMQAVSLQTARTRYGPEEPVRLEARQRGAAQGARMRLTLFGARRGEPLERRSVVLDAGGKAEIELDALQPGAYLARLEAEAEAGTGLRAEEAFVVTGGGRERSQPRPRPGLLERIAEATGGRSDSVDTGALDALEFAEGRRYRVEASTTRPLLGVGWALGLVLALWTLEWFLRRRWGFA